MGFSFFWVLSCSCWLSLIGFDFGCFFVMSFAKCLLAVAVYGGALSSVMAERKREREASGGEREMGRKSSGPSNGNKLGST